MTIPDASASPADFGAYAMACSGDVEAKFKATHVVPDWFPQLSKMERGWMIATTATGSTFESRIRRD